MQPSVYVGHWQSRRTKTGPLFKRYRNCTTVCARGTLLHNAYLPAYQRTWLLERATQERLIVHTLLQSNQNLGLTENSYT